METTSGQVSLAKNYPSLKFVIALVLLSSDNDNKLVKVLAETDSHYVLNTFVRDVATSIKYRVNVLEA